MTDNALSTAPTQLGATSGRRTTGTSDGDERAGAHLDAGLVLADDREPSLHGRRSECGLLDRLLTSTRGGQSQVLVLRGEAGVGKTALLDYLVGRGPDCRIARASGVESETELAFAGLHQLCAPFLGRLGQLPDPQRMRWRRHSV